MVDPILFLNGSENTAKFLSKNGQPARLELTEDLIVGSSKTFATLISPEFGFVSDHLFYQPGFTDGNPGSTQSYPKKPLINTGTKIIYLHNIIADDKMMSRLGIKEEVVDKIRQMSQDRLWKVLIVWILWIESAEFDVDRCLPVNRYPLKKTKQFRNGSDDLKEDLLDFAKFLDGPHWEDEVDAFTKDVRLLVEEVVGVEQADMTKDAAGAETEYLATLK